MASENQKTKPTLILPALLIGLAVAGLVLGLSGAGGFSLTPVKLYEKLAIPLLKLVCYLAVGLLVGQLIESLGWTSRLAQLVRPLTRWARLKEQSGAAFVAGFVSGIVANTMLMNAHSEGKISHKELVLTYLVNNGLPMYLVHLPTTFFIVTTLAGHAGLVYLAITFVAASIRSLAALAAARATLPVLRMPSVEPSVGRYENGGDMLVPLLKKFRNRFARLLLYAVPIYALVFLINQWGIFVWLRTALAQWVAADLFPVEAAGLVVFTFVAEFSSGMAAGGAMIDAGTLTAKATAIALIVGTVVSTPIRAVRHQLPTHAGIFSLGLGSELLFLSQAFRILTLILVTVPYALWA